MLLTPCKNHCNIHHDYIDETLEAPESRIQTGLQVPGHYQSMLQSSHSLTTVFHDFGHGINYHQRHLMKNWLLEAEILQTMVTWNNTTTK